MGRPIPKILFCRNHLLLLIAVTDTGCDLTEDFIHFSLKRFLFATLRIYQVGAWLHWWKIQAYKTILRWLVIKKKRGKGFLVKGFYSTLFAFHTTHIYCSLPFCRNVRRKNYNFTRNLRANLLDGEDTTISSKKIKHFQIN